MCVFEAESRSLATCCACEGETRGKHITVPEVTKDMLMLLMSLTCSTAAGSVVSGGFVCTQQRARAAGKGVFNKETRKYDNVPMVINEPCAPLSITELMSHCMIGKPIAVQRGRDFYTGRVKGVDSRTRNTYSNAVRFGARLIDKSQYRVRYEWRIPPGGEVAYMTHDECKAAHETCQSLSPFIVPHPTRGGDPGAARGGKADAHQSGHIVAHAASRRPLPQQPGRCARARDLIKVCVVAV